MSLAFFGSINFKVALLHYGNFRTENLSIISTGTIFSKGSLKSNNSRSFYGHLALCESYLEGEVLHRSKIRNANSDSANFWRIFPSKLTGLRKFHEPPRASSCKWSGKAPRRRAAQATYSPLITIKHEHKISQQGPSRLSRRHLLGTETGL